MKFKLPEIYFTSRSYAIVASLVFVYLLGFINVFFYHAANILFLLCVITLAIDIFILFRNKTGVNAKRPSAVKLSNGDDNIINIHLENNYLFNINACVIDELPIQFQIRDFERKIKLESGKESIIRYSLRPVERGEYHFGALRVFVSSILKLIERRFSFEQKHPIKTGFR